MNIFVCYARVDRPYCSVIEKNIDNHDVWSDDRLYAGDNWWDIILQRLNWCHVLVFLVSNNSLKSPACKRELAIAIRSKKRIVPILLDADAKPNIPKEISKLHWIDMTQSTSADVIHQMTRSLYSIEQERAADPQLVVPVSPNEHQPYDASGDPITHVGHASKLIQMGEFDRANMILQRVLVSTQNLTPMIRQSLDEMINDNEARLKEQTSERTRDMDYRFTCMLAVNPAMRQKAIQAFNDFAGRFPDYDPAGARHMLFGKQAPAGVPGKTAPTQLTPAAPQKPARTADFYMPLLEFLPVHTVGSMRPFEMARYPVTNQQFNQFINDLNGAARLRWWTYSDWARNHHEKSATLLAAPPSEDLHPRVACWYDAMAFCFYLSDQIGRRVLLPSRAQRLRAAQGTDGRLYPSGNELTPNQANYRDSGLHHSTPVTQYTTYSPYGMADMSGNLWEWLLDSTDPKAPYNHKTQADRYLAGGSYRSTLQEMRVTGEMKQPSNLIAPTIGFRAMILLEAK